MKCLLLRMLPVIAAVSATSAVAGVPLYEPAQLGANGIVIFRPMENITLSFEKAGTALVRPKVQTRHSNDDGGIYLQFHAERPGGRPPRTVRDRFSVRNMSGHPVVIRGTVTLLDSARPMRFTIQCRHGDWVNEIWYRAVSEVRITDFSMATPAKSK